MGVLPLQFMEGTSAQSLGLDGSEVYQIKGLSNDIRPRQKLPLRIERQNGRSETIEVVLRIDTPIEVDYYRQGGILPYVLRGLVGAVPDGGA
jgi:aconitate hydratase